MKYSNTSIAMRFFVYALPVIFLFAACTSTKQAAAIIPPSQEALDSAVAANKWIFNASQAIPQRGRSRMLTGSNQLKCSGDTVTAYLPYFGQAYSAVIGETKSPLDFKSTDFAITKQKGSKGRWNIVIKPNDYREVQTLSFTFFSTGSAQLNVQMTNRSSINFNGSVLVIR